MLGEAPVEYFLTVLARRLYSSFLVSLALTPHFGILIGEAAQSPGSLVLASPRHGHPGGGASQPRFLQIVETIASLVEVNV